MNKDLNRIINIFYELYEENFHFIKNMDISDGDIKGEFVIPDRQYTVDPVSGLSAACSIILCTQVLLVGIIYNHIVKYWKIDMNLKLTSGDVKGFAKKIMISKYNQVKFKKPILHGSPKFFTLTFEKVIDKYDTLGVIIYNAHFSINNGEHAISVRAFAARNINQLISSAGAS